MSTAHGQAAYSEGSARTDAPVGCAAQVGNAEARSSPLLLLPQPAEDDLAGLGIPDPSQNLFTRIIRDPTRPDRPMRETRCTEMLCSVLMSCPSLRGHVFRWMAGVSGQAGLMPEDLDDLDWKLATERFIGGKRDDLRIEGWRTISDEDERLEVLWTVEVKVQAGFHQSTDMTVDVDEDDGGSAAGVPVADEGKDGEAAGGEDAMVNQLLNYDSWLASRDVPYKAGFVLAIPNHQEDLPDGLKFRWTCLTWTGLGETVKEALEKDSIPPQEKILAQHLLGFIHQHLWRRDEMADGELTFDHLALLRAYWAIGRECETLVDKMVAPLVDVFKQSGLGLDEPYHQNLLFRPLQRSAVYSVFSCTKEIYLLAGVTEGVIRVSCESATRFKHKEKLCARYKSLLPELRRNGRHWLTELGPWRDLCTQKPLVELLSESDQAKAIREFVAGALADLKAVEIDRIISETCNGSAT